MSTPTKSIDNSKLPPVRRCDSVVPLPLPGELPFAYMRLPPVRRCDSVVPLPLPGELPFAYMRPFPAQRGSY